MRVVVKYTKGERVKYISHLDFMRLVQRALRRADIPVAYSHGFNPHPRVSFASALSVGTTSEGEYLDISLDKEMEPKLLCQRMNENLPEGIRFIDSKKIDKKSPSLMSLIERAEYLIILSHHPFSKCDIIYKIEEFLSQREIMITRVNKRGEHQVNIRDKIHSLNVIEQNGEKIILKTLTSTGSRVNLRPEQLIEALIDFIDVPLDPELILGIHRLNLYLPKNKRWVTPIEIE